MKQRRKPRAAFWRRLVLAALGVVLGVGVCLANGRDLAGDQMPMPFGTGVAVVMSGSMSPALEVGDLVIIRERDLYEVGDVVVYQSGARLIVHRIIAREGDWITTQGDANNVSDAPIEISSVKGKVIAHVPRLGHAVNALKTPVGILTVLLIAFVVVERAFRRERNRDEKELDAIKEEIRRLKEQEAIEEEVRRLKGEHEGKE